MGPSGGAALYRRALLEDVGLLEPGFFNYLEDVDLAWRALLRGWRSVVVPQARARHIYSATAGQGSPFKQRLLGRNRLRMILRCMPRRCCCAACRRFWPTISSPSSMAYSRASRRLPPVAWRHCASCRRCCANGARSKRAVECRWARSGAGLQPSALPWSVLREQRAAGGDLCVRVDLTREGTRKHSAKEDKQ